MSKELKWMLLGVFLAVVSVWCLLFASGNAVLSYLSVFLLILGVGFFAGGYSGGRPRNAEPPDYQMENIDIENNEKERKS